MNHLLSPIAPKQKWTSTLVAPSFLLLAVVILFALNLIPGRFLMLRDLFSYHYPWRIFLKHSLQSGSLPLWNPYTGCGEPFLADPQTGVLYPLNWLCFFLPVSTAIIVSIVFHTWLAAFGVYTFCRQWSLSFHGSLMAACSFPFSTMFIARIEFYPVMASGAYYPVILSAFTFWLGRRTFGRCILVGVLMALQILAGYPEAVIFTAATLMLYACFVSVSDWLRSRSPVRALLPIAVVLGALAIAFLLAAPQIFPSLEAAQLSQRTTIDPEIDRGSVNPFMLLSLFFPSLYGVPGYNGSYWAPACGEFWLGAFYAGLMPMAAFTAAAFLIFFSKGARHKKETSKKALPKQPDSLGDIESEWFNPRLLTVFLITVLLCFLFYAMGKYTPLYGTLWDIIPFLRKFRWPSKSLMCVVFALSCLSAVSLDWLRNQTQLNNGERWRSYLIRWSPVLAFSGLSLFMMICLANEGRVGKWVLTFFFNLDAVQPGQGQNIPWEVLGKDAIKLAILGPIAALALASHVFLDKRGKITGWLIVLIVCTDLFITDYRLLPTGNQQLLETPQTMGEADMEGQQVHRSFSPDQMGQILLYGVEEEWPFLSAHDAMMGCWPMAHKTFELSQWSSFKPRNVGQVLGIAYDQRLPKESRTRLLRMLSCGRVVHAPDIAGFLNDGAKQEKTVTILENPLRQAFAVGRVEVLPDENAILQKMATEPWKPQHTALVSQAEGSGHVFAGLEGGDIHCEVTLLKRNVNEVKVECKSDKPALLVLTDTFFPGWRAERNGQPAEIYRVNGAFRGVLIQPGESSIIMRYKPKPFFAGCLISLITFTGLFAFVFARRRKAASK